MRIALLAVLFAAGCLPPLANPPPGTPATVVEQCAVDATEHNAVMIGGYVLGGAGGAGLITSVEVNNGHNASTTNAIADTSAVAMALGLTAGVLLAPLITVLKYIPDHCVPVTGPLPSYTSPRLATVPQS